MKKHKVFICWTLNSGTTFYRMMNPIPFIKNRVSFAMSKWSPNFQEVSDWEYKIQGNGKTDAGVAQDLEFLTAECDITISQKFHSLGGLALMDFYRAKFPNKPWYTELDDHVFEVNPSSPASINYYAGSEASQTFEEQLRLSTGLIVSTENLRREYEKYNPNIWVVPNGINFNIWDKLKRPKKIGKKIRIGWAGGGSHVDDLEFIEPAITAIAKKFSNVEFVFLGGIPPSFKDRTKIKAISKWYPIDKYPQAIADLNIDIALAPLRDNLFNRAKSNLRWLEYSALGIPTIASRVEPFNCIIEGHDGVLVTEVSEWEKAMEDLIKDATLRNTIGRNAYIRVKKDFNEEKIAETYADYIGQMIAGKKQISTRAAINLMADDLPPES